MRKSCYDKHKKYTELGNFIDENLQDFSLENPIDSFCDYQCCDFGPQYKTRVFKRDIDEFLVQPKSERLLEEAMKLRDIRISTLTSDSESFVLISDLETEEDCEAEKEPEEINQGTVSQKCEDFPVTDKGSINYNTQCRFCDKLSHWPADCTQAGRYHCYLEDNGKNFYLFRTTIFFF